MPENLVIQEPLDLTFDAYFNPTKVGYYCFKVRLLELPHAMSHKTKANSTL